MVTINDVGPRDGLQSQTKILHIDDRISLIRSLAEAGVSSIEVGAFVSPKAVPAMAGTDQVLKSISAIEDVTKTVLIPNQRGYEIAKENGARRVAMVLYATESMAVKNVNMSVADVERNTQSIVEKAKQDGIEVSAYIATAFGCPFDGDVKPAHVAELVGRYFEYGVDEIVLADTIGSANPALVKQTFKPITDRYGNEKLAAHFHDTRAMGLANVYSAYETGIRKFDASIGGLGGCPFAPGASGNVATEDVVMMFQQMGVETGIDMLALLRASNLAIELTGTTKGGRARPWLDGQIENFKQA
ncbi:MAG: hydroxymethylglutaryl-CoA lyase [Acidiferrobacterales bacterium]|nr:hydroxymethylglutaryl-CoA lyase [Acidiferrobacterales bacterium]